MENYPIWNNYYIKMYYNIPLDEITDLFIVPFLNI